MLVYRLSLQKYGTELQSSGIEARWNYRGEYVIYTASSRSLALLENLVHRGFTGMGALFYVFTIEIPERVVIKTINEKTANLSAINKSRESGSDWLRNAETAVLEVPSSIVPEESNFIFNISHPDFMKIKLNDVKPFEIDGRIRAGKS